MQAYKWRLGYESGIVYKVRHVDLMTSYRWWSGLLRLARYMGSWAENFTSWRLHSDFANNKDIYPPPINVAKNKNETNKGWESWRSRKKNLSIGRYQMALMTEKKKKWNRQIAVFDNAEIPPADVWQQRFIK